MALGTNQSIFSSKPNTKKMKMDYEIDEMEMEIEEECLKILALYQPATVDPRFFTVVMKINNDLERIAEEVAYCKIVICSLYNYIFVG